MLYDLDKQGRKCPLDTPMIERREREKEREREKGRRRDIGGGEIREREERYKERERVKGRGISKQISKLKTLYKQNIYP
jgi:hypothetical protein